MGDDKVTGTQQVKGIEGKATNSIGEKSSASTKWILPLLVLLIGVSLLLYFSRGCGNVKDHAITNILASKFGLPPSVTGAIAASLPGLLQKFSNK